MLFEKTREIVEQNNITMRQENDRAMSKVESAIQRMQESMDKDRAHAATDRANISATMVTRAELERQIDRVVEAFTLHGRIGSAD